MTTDPTVFAEIETIIRASAGDFGAELTITPESTFSGLGMESLDLVVLAGRIQEHFGSAVNFAQFVSDSDDTKAMSTRIQDLVDYIEDVLAAPLVEGAR